MKAVGIKALKNNLSKYLRDVRAGETVWVTDRDEIIAEIHQPTTPNPGKVTRWESWLNAQEKSGSLRKAVGSSLPASLGAKPRPPRRKIDLQTILDETREERS